MVALICLVVLLSGCASGASGKTRLDPALAGSSPAKQDIPPGIVLLKKSF